jgi:hypothetical protein
VKRCAINASITLILGLGLALALLRLLPNLLPARADRNILYVATDEDDTNDCSIAAERCRTARRAVDLAATDGEIGEEWPLEARVDIGVDEPSTGLSVTKQADPNPVQDDAQLTYTLRVVNTSDVELHATITDALPAHVAPTGILTWTPVTITVGGTWTQTVVVTTEKDYTGSLVNVVQVTTEEGAIDKASVTVCANACKIYLPVVLKNYPAIYITGIICRPKNDSIDLQGNKVFLPTRHFDRFGYDYSSFWTLVINPQTDYQIEAQIIAFRDSNSMRTWEKCDFALKKTMREALGGDLNEVVKLPMPDRPPRTLIFLHTIVPTQD